MLADLFFLTIVGYIIVYSFKQKPTRILLIVLPLTLAFILAAKTYSPIAQFLIRSSGENPAILTLLSILITTLPAFLMIRFSSKVIIATGYYFFLKITPSTSVKNLYPSLISKTIKMVGNIIIFTCRFVLGAAMGSVIAIFIASLIIGISHIGKPAQWLTENSYTTRHLTPYVNNFFQQALSPLQPRIQTYNKLKTMANPNLIFIDTAKHLK